MDKRRMDGNFIVESGGYELLPRVETLWYELKDHHSRIDPEFPDMSAPSFESSENGLKKNSRQILVDFVRCATGNVEAGYCISVIDDKDIGEIESLYVRKEFRKLGVGKELLNRALAWLDQNGAKAKRLSVLSGNTEAIAFYRSFGFESRLQELMIPTEPKHNRTGG